MKYFIYFQLYFRYICVSLKKNVMMVCDATFSLTVFCSFLQQIPLVFGFVCATVWMSLVCCSRIYLGMHTVLVCH